MENFTQANFFFTLALLLVTNIMSAQSTISWKGSRAHLLIGGFIKQSILPGGEFHEGGARPDKEAEAALSSSSA